MNDIDFISCCPNVVFEDGVFIGIDYIANTGTNGSPVNLSILSTFDGSGGLVGDINLLSFQTTPKEVVPEPAPLVCLAEAC